MQFVWNSRLTVWLGRSSARRSGRVAAPAPVGVAEEFESVDVQGRDIGDDAERRRSRSKWFAFPLARTELRLCFRS